MRSDPKLSDLPEGEILRRIFPRLPEADATLLGPGDDAAVIAAPDGRFVVTTDMMVSGPDFRLEWSTPYELGYKAAASNLADVAAMGAKPTALVVALAVPGNTPMSTLEQLADGLREACEFLAPGCGVVGGDLSSSDTFTIAVTAFGDLAGRKPLTRAGARVGDVVALAGEPGWSSLGLALLFAQGTSEIDGERVPNARLMKKIRDELPNLIGRHLAPAPPVSLGVVAAQAGATACMDVSDSLTLDASRMAEASSVAIDFDHLVLDGFAAELSKAYGVELEVSRRAVMHGGEDHCLLACFPPGEVLPAGFKRVGQVIAGRTALDRVMLRGESIEPIGWNPYAQ